MAVFRVSCNTAGRIRESWPHRSVGSGHSEVLAGLNLTRAAVGPVFAWESIATVHSARRALQHSHLSVETEPFFSALHLKPRKRIN